MILQWLRQLWTHEARTALLRVTFVISAWLGVFFIGTWLPSSAYIQAVIYNRPLEWDKQSAADEVLLSLQIPETSGGISNLDRLMQIDWHAPHATSPTAGAAENSAAKYEQSAMPNAILEVSRIHNGTRAEKSSIVNDVSSGHGIEAIASFHCTDDTRIIDEIRKALFPSEKEPVISTRAIVNLIRASAGANASIEGNANTLQITLKRPAATKADDGKLPWLTRWFYCLPLGLLSGSLINLCALCVLASMAGEYTRDALGEDAENPTKPDVPASMFRGFVVFLFFISGQLIFLGNLPGGPSSEDALMTFSQATYVRTAGFASVICLACSYNPAIILLLLSKISSLMDSSQSDSSSEAVDEVDYMEGTAKSEAPEDNRKSPLLSRPQPETEMSLLGLVEEIIAARRDGGKKIDNEEERIQAVAAGFSELTPESRQMLTLVLDPLEKAMSEHGVDLESFHKAFYSESLAGMNSTASSEPEVEAR